MQSFSSQETFRQLLLFHIPHRKVLDKASCLFLEAVTWIVVLEAIAWAGVTLQAHLDRAAWLQLLCTFTAINFFYVTLWFPLTKNVYQM